MIVAVAIWDNRISPVFDVSRKVLILEIENGIASRTGTAVFTNDNPTHKLSRLIEHQVETLICGAISQPMAEMLSAQGIHIIPFIAGEHQEVIAAFLEGKLPSTELSMPGRRGRCRTRHQARAGAHCRKNIKPIQSGSGQCFSKRGKAGSKPETGTGNRYRKLAAAPEYGKP